MTVYRPGDGLQCDDRRLAGGRDQSRFEGGNRWLPMPLPHPAPIGARRLRQPDDRQGATSASAPHSRSSPKRHGLIANNGMLEVGGTAGGSGLIHLRVQHAAGYLCHGQRNQRRRRHLCRWQRSRHCPVRDSRLLLSTTPARSPWVAPTPPCAQRHRHRQAVFSDRVRSASAAATTPWRWHASTTTARSLQAVAPCCSTAASRHRHALGRKWRNAHVAGGHRQRSNACLRSERAGDTQRCVCVRGLDHRLWLG